jgi:hypothetical protein
MLGEEIIPTILTLNIYIGLYVPNTRTLTPLRLYKMFEVLHIVRINNSVGLWGIVNFHQLRDPFPYRLAGGIPLQEGVPNPLQSKVRTPHPYLH